MPTSTRLPSVPFPEDISTAPLRVIDYASLLAHDPVESKKLFQCAVDLGFFYLKNHGLDYEPLKDIMEEVFELPEEEKAKYDVALTDTTFGWKRVGYDNVDELGSLDTNEQFNASRDDLIAWPKHIHLPSYPKPIKDQHQVLRDFTSHARNVGLTLLKHFEAHLELPQGALTSLHREGPGFKSPTKARVIKSAPQSDPDSLTIGSHSDFGSITLLDNNMTGGLQVLPPGEGEWMYVKPLKGHIVCNIADALSILSGGILHSNLHRVKPPPGAQHTCTRWSGVFFFVPDYETILQPLEEESELVRQAAKTMSKRPLSGTTCKAHFDRRIFGVRAVNRTGPESWLNSRGMEHVVVKGHTAQAA